MRRKLRPLARRKSPASSCPMPDQGEDPRRLPMRIAFLVAGLLLLALPASASASYQFDRYLPGQWGAPMGGAPDSAGHVYIANNSYSQVRKYSSSGAFISQLGSNGSGDGQFYSPTGVAIDSSGNIYVLDSGNQRVEKFSSSGVFLRMWGWGVDDGSNAFQFCTSSCQAGIRGGPGDGQFNFPYAIAVDPSGNVYVADTGNSRVQKFSSSGAFITKWSVTDPRGIATDSSGNVYVSSLNQNRIQKYSSSGAFITQWGTTGSGNGQFNAPYGIATDSSDNVYVAEFNNRRVQKFSSSGAFITKFGSFGTGDGQFEAPVAVTVDSSGVYVSDWGSDGPARVQKFCDCPQTTITSGPSGLTNNSSVSFSFSSSEPGSSFECRLDSNQEADFQACDSPKPYTNLTDGTHTFAVRATSGALGTDPSPASRTFTIDTSPPETTITDGPSGLTNEARPTFAFSSSETGSSFQCRVDSDSYAACSGSWTTSRLTNGSHTFYVRATDPAGNTDPTPASRTFTVDALNEIPAPTFVTNGQVNAIAPTPSATYIGGEFTRVGPPTGGGAVIDASTGISTGLPQIAGGTQTVAAVAPDGSGGFYIGGGFSRVDSVPRAGLAHVLADGSVDAAWNPPDSATVQAIAFSGSTVYVGGRGITALDAATGELKWHREAGTFGSVYAIAVYSSTVYIGGNFTAIGYGPSDPNRQARAKIAALDANTGETTAWNPGANGPVQALAVSGSTVYAGGSFTSIGGQARNRIAALDATTGAATAWDPNANGVVRTLSVSGSIVYAGGDFTSFFPPSGRQTRNRIAALNRATGAATPWNPNANAAVHDLVISGSTVYAGGQFTSIGGQARDYLAALNVTGGAATSWNPRPWGSVGTLALSGSTIYAGGGFNSIGGKTRNRIAALDPSTGEVTSWNPNANGVVNALSVFGSTVYAGGDFTSIGGKTRNRIAALTATTGAATAWNPNANSSVSVLRVSDPTVYAGGGFTSIGGKTRNRIAALNRTTGAATAWNPNANAAVLAMRLSGSTVYAAGKFTSIGGKPRGRIAALNTTNGAATPWDPGANNQVQALAVSGSTVYAGGTFTGIGGQARRFIAALNQTTGAATAWNPNNSNNNTGDVKVIAAVGPLVYVGGGFNRIGGQVDRNGIAELDATSGALTSWNPNPTPRPITALAAGPDGSLWIGGAFTRFPTAAQSGIARFTH
jgi:hypothetical protein